MKTLFCAQSYKRKSYKRSVQTPHRKTLAAVVAFVALAAIFASSCENNTGAVDGELKPRYFTNVRDAEARWQQHKIQSYSLLQRRICFCIFGANTYRITVKNGVITSIVDTTTKSELHADLRPLFLNVEGLFAEVKKLESQKNDYLEIAYDSVYGYPRLISVDISRNLADEEYTIRTDLEIKP